jgi:hypothetical protein
MVINGEVVAYLMAGGVFELVPINSTGRVRRVYMHIHFRPGVAIVELPEFVRVIDA